MLLCIWILIVWLVSAVTPANVAVVAKEIGNMMIGSGFMMIPMSQAMATPNPGVSVLQLLLSISISIFLSGLVFKAASLKNFDKTGLDGRSDKVKKISLLIICWLFMAFVILFGSYSPAYEGRAGLLSVLFLSTSLGWSTASVAYSIVLVHAFVIILKLIVSFFQKKFD